jgi:hypothetical protein
VLDETAASYESLQVTHQAALEELSALKRWIYGRRSEKIVEGEGQSHLFDLEPSNVSATPLEPRQELSRPATARRRRRELDLDQLPHFRHEHDLNEAHKQCSCCGRAKDRIGQDESRILEYVPAKLEVHVYVRLPVLQGWRDEPTTAGAADCSWHCRTRADRSDHRR